MLIKKKSLSLPGKLVLGTFYKLLTVLTPLFNCPEVLPSASDKAKFFSKVVSRNSNIEDRGIFLLMFTFRTNLKLHNIL